MICSRCVYDDETIPGLTFDVEGVCPYCRMTEELKEQYGTGTPVGKSKLNMIVEQIKTSAIGNKYDCVVGISGGTDSSYMLDWAVSHGLRCLAVTYDNGWGHPVADTNMEKVTKALDVDFVRVAPDPEEVNDILRAFFCAGVIDLDSSSDIALAEVLYREAARHKVKYILEGHSFTTEGVSPLSTLYMDGRYIRSISEQFGTMHLKTFPNMNLWSMLKWTLFKRIRKIRPYWYLGHSKPDARAYLTAKYNWQYYDGHHLENKMTEFHHSYYVLEKFGYDGRANGLAAEVREGTISRSKALEILSTPPSLSENLLDIIREKFYMTEEQFFSTLRSPARTFRQFPTYKRTFERLRPLFYLLAKADLVPMSFYKKYCRKGV